MNVNTSASTNKKKAIVKKAIVKKAIVKKACILAAGIGKRLAPLTDTRPKPLIPIAGKPLLQHTIEDLRDNGITEILLIVGYRKDQIIEYFGNGQEFGLSIQ
ncbi:MAG: nucleotidyltransferase family protein, partial [Promethearchaeota archaeon]